MLTGESSSSLLAAAASRLQECRTTFTKLKINTTLFQSLTFQKIYNACQTNFSDKEENFHRNIFNFELYLISGLNEVLHPT